MDNKIDFVVMRCLNHNLTCEIMKSYTIDRDRSYD